MEATQSESNTVEVETGQRDTSTTVRYLEAGSGPPLVLLHGVGLDAAGISWKHAIPELAATHRVVAPDLPGHGESEKPDIAYTTDYYIEVLDALVAALDIECPSLAGISMGGCVALGYALENDVDRLALVDSYGLGTDAAWRPMAATALRTPGMGQVVWSAMGTNEHTVKQTLRGYTTRTPEAFVTEVHEVLQDPGCKRALNRWQRSEFGLFGFRSCYLGDLGDLSAPTLLVHGDDDTLLPAAWSRRAADRLPESELHVLEECGHWPPRERPERFNDLLAAFMGS